MESPVEYIEKAYSDASYNYMIYKIGISNEFLPNLIKRAKEIELENNNFFISEINKLKQEIINLKQIKV